jgi:hypothetical protein
LDDDPVLNAPSLREFKAMHSSGNPLKSICSVCNCKLIELLIIRLNSQCGHYNFRKKERRRKGCRFQREHNTINMKLAPIHIGLTDQGCHFLHIRQEDLSKYPYNEINGKQIVEVRQTISSSASSEDVEKRRPFLFTFTSSSMLQAGQRHMMKWKFIVQGKIVQIKTSKKMGYQENEAAQTGNPHPNISTT